MKIKRRGRPRKGTTEVKSESILLRLDRGEKRGFANAAKIAGISLSAWIRERLRRVAKGELEEAHATIPFLPNR
jgi:predicted HicB family RNase H-like nuclease